LSQGPAFTKKVPVNVCCATAGATHSHGQSRSAPIRRIGRPVYVKFPPFPQCALKVDKRRLNAVVLDSVSSPITRRVYNLGLDEFIAW
jgi:hypothetical protein